MTANSLLAVACLVVSNEAVRAGKPIQYDLQSFEKVTFREPHPQTYFIPADTWESNDETHRSSLSGHFGSPLGPEVIFTNRLVIQRRAARVGYTSPFLDNLPVVRRITNNLYILETATAREAIQFATDLLADRHIQAAYPLMRRLYLAKREFVPRPNDRYFAQIWHAENRQANGARIGIDLNLRAAWSRSQGAGVTVALADNGIDLDHPDLRSPAANGLHFDFGDRVARGGFINDDAHGTAVAGLIAAHGNNEIGVIGVAPQATLSSLIIFDINRRGREGIVPDDALMDMFAYRIQEVPIQNHSWGSVAGNQSGIDALSNAGIEEAISQGRDGKGVIMIRAGGNERSLLNNANDDGFTNDPRTIAVGAVRFDGRVTSYSTPGACLLVAAPSGDLGFPGVATTDHQGAQGFVTRGRGDIEDYLLGDSGFAGTSAAAPIIAGLTALLIDVNPELSYRDVQQILIHSARQPSDAVPDLATNAAGFAHSHSTGFGVPDANYATALATEWKTRPPFQEIIVQGPSNRSIADARFRVTLSGSALPSNLRSLPALPSRGTFAEEGIGPMPLRLVDLNAPGGAIPSLDGQAALVQVADEAYAEAIYRVADAGAAFAIIYEDSPFFDTLPPLSLTDFAMIPAASISSQQGEQIATRLQNGPETAAAIGVDATTITFDVDETMICEHVGIRIDTSHTFRGDLRITLHSPHETVSVLQAQNSDTSDGPVDWTYWSVKHFFESSKGRWTLRVTDQQENDTGRINSVSLIVRGVPILDIDADGLEDNWERRNFGSLRWSGRDDPDNDGLNNAREQILGTDAERNDRPLQLRIIRWDNDTLRLSWPGNTGADYSLLRHTTLGSAGVTVFSGRGRFPEMEFFVPLRAEPRGIFSLRRQAEE